MNSSDFNIFRTRRFTSAEGLAVEFSASALRDIAASYDPVTHPAPIVIGDPPSNGPALGWVDKLAFDGDFLKAIPTRVKPALRDAVLARRYQKGPI